MIKMSLISEIMSCVLAHGCDFDTDDWIFSDRSVYDAYRAKPMPTITDIESYKPSTLRAICRYITEYNIQNEPFYNIIAQMINNPSSPITHEFVVESHIKDFGIWPHILGDLSKIFKHVHDIDSSTLLYILTHCYIDTEIDFEFTNKFRPIFESICSNKEIVYEMLAERFPPRGRLTKSARRDIFN